MNWEMARDLVLEADLTDLRGEGHGDLARHIRGCPACRALAQRILDQTAALQATLERAASRRAADPSTSRRRRASRAAVRRWAIGIPLTLAASLAVLWLGRRQAGQTPASGVPSQLALATTPLDVQVPPGQTVTVFQTDNPNIVVIWSF